METFLLIYLSIAITLLLWSDHRNFGSREGSKFSESASKELHTDPSQPNPFVEEDAVLITPKPKKSYKLTCYKEGLAIPKSEVIEFLEEERELSPMMQMAGIGMLLLMMLLKG